MRRFFFNPFNPCKSVAKKPHPNLSLRGMWQSKREGARKGCLFFLVFYLFLTVKTSKVYAKFAKVFTTKGIKVKQKKQRLNRRCADF